MERIAEYLIVQHTPDLFRQEFFNIGVVVKTGDALAGKFKGETSPSQLDRRRLKWSRHPASYTQWVEHWRRLMAADASNAWDAISRTTLGSYRAVKMGELSGFGTDTVEEILNYLYATLVSEGGFAEAISGPDEAEAVKNLNESISTSLRNLDLLSDDSIFSNAKHPVILRPTIAGQKVATHTPSFFQRNGHMIVMETIDLAVTRGRERMKDRAGLASYMFDDIRDSNSSAEAIAIVQLDTATQTEENTAYALAMLRSTATSIINWNSDNDRSAFLRDRKAVANA